MAMWPAPVVLYLQGIYRAAQAAGAGEPLLANWRWHPCLWTDPDRALFQSAMQPAQNANIPATGGEPTASP